MKKISKILVIIDPTVERDFVVERARMLAASTRAHTTFFINSANTLSENAYLYEGVDGEFFATQRKLFKQHYEKILAELEEEYRAAGLAVTTTFSENHNLAESIIDQASQSSPDILLKSTHHHNTLERTLISNTDWRLIRKCPSPLMLVKPGKWQDGGCVVTAVDPMHSKSEQTRLDHKLVTSTADLARTLGAEPWVFHSYYPFVSTLFPMGGETQEHLDRISELHRNKVMELIGETEIPPTNVQLSQGDLVSELIKFLRSRKTNLLVIGALSRNVIERAIVGNTAERILEDCPCDILVLKS